MGNQPAKSSKLKKWSPFLDKEGVLRANSRLSSSQNLSEDVRYPVLLTSKDDMTKLMIGSFHLRFKHPVGSALMLAKIQKHHIVLGLNRYTRKLANNCVTCRRMRPVVEPQLLGPLPLDVVDLQKRAFSVTGIDFAGLF